MQRYIAEVYLPRSHALEAEASGQRARTAASELSSEGLAIRYLSTTFLPDDETCFHFFEAASADEVSRASERAGLGRVRVVTAIEA